MGMRNGEVKCFSTPGYDFPSHRVVVVKTANEFILSIPSLKWCYNVGSWTSRPQYWKEKLETVLTAQDKHYEIDPVANGLAAIDPEPQTLKEYIESDPERHVEYKRFCRENYGS
jgi:hypothetical protein